MEQSPGMASLSMRGTELVACLNACALDPQIGRMSRVLASYLSQRLTERGDTSMGARQFFDFAVAAREMLANGMHAGAPIMHSYAGNASVREASVDEIATAFLGRNERFGQQVIALACA